VTGRHGNATGGIRWKKGAVVRMGGRCGLSWDNPHDSEAGGKSFRSEARISANVYESG